MFSHALKVDPKRRVTQVRHRLSSYHGVFLFEVCLIVRVSCSNHLSVRAKNFILEVLLNAI